MNIGLFGGESFSDKMVKYFINAIRSYVLTEGKEEFYAAFVSAVTCGKRDRSRCTQYLNEGMDSFLKKAEIARHNGNDKDIDIYTKFYGQLATLKDLLEEKDWTIRDSVKEKNNLGSINPEYLRALKKGDYEVFVRKYPRLGS